MTECNIDVFYFFNGITKEEWDTKSSDWKNGWRTGELGEDMRMSKKEIESMSEDWKDGLNFALSHSRKNYDSM